jgi:hypothetical protein
LPSAGEGCVEAVAAGEFAHVAGADDRAEDAGERGLDRSRFGGGWDIFRAFLTMRGTDDGIDTEGVHRGVQGVSGRVRDQ